VGILKNAMLTPSAVSFLKTLAPPFSHDTQWVCTSGYAPGITGKIRPGLCTQPSPAQMVLRTDPVHTQ